MNAHAKNDEIQTPSCKNSYVSPKNAIIEMIKVVTSI